MQTLTDDKVTEIFCIIDDFCKEFSKIESKNDFCETYFIVQHNTDRLIVRHDIFSEYRRSSYSATMTVTSFKTALEQYCLYKGFIFCPDKLDCYSKSNGRLIKECYYAGEKKSYEMIYVQTKGTELNNDLPACYVRL